MSEESAKKAKVPVGENGPMTVEDCVHWLHAEYSRHNELEDEACAMMLVKQAAEIAFLTEQVARLETILLNVHESQKHSSKALA